VALKKVEVLIPLFANDNGDEQAKEEFCEIPDGFFLWLVQKARNRDLTQFSNQI